MTREVAQGLYDLTRLIAAIALIIACLFSDAPFSPVQVFLAIYVAAGMLIRNFVWCDRD